MLWACSTSPARCTLQVFERTPSSSGESDISSTSEKRKLMIDWNLTWWYLNISSTDDFWKLEISLSDICISQFASIWIKSLQLKSDGCFGSCLRKLNCSKWDRKAFLLLSSINKVVPYMWSVSHEQFDINAYNTRVWIGKPIRMDDNELRKTENIINEIQWNNKWTCDWSRTALQYVMKRHDEYSCGKDQNAEGQDLQHMPNHFDYSDIFSLDSSASEFCGRLFFR